MCGAHSTAQVRVVASFHDPLHVIERMHMHASIALWGTRTFTDGIMDVRLAVKHVHVTPAHASTTLRELNLLFYILESAVHSFMYMLLSRSPTSVEYLHTLVVLYVLRRPNRQRCILNLPGDFTQADTILIRPRAHGRGPRRVHRWRMGPIQCGSYQSVGESARVRHVLACGYS